MKKAVKVIIFIILVIAIVLAGALAYMTMTEYKPDKIEQLEVMGQENIGDQMQQQADQYAQGNYEWQPEDQQVNTPKIFKKSKLRLVTWNIGYGALGSGADFFMSGGDGVITATEKEVRENTNSIINRLNEFGADAYFLQEVDRDSKRSHGFDEVEMITEQMGVGSAENGIEKRYATFANNIKVNYIPYPWPPLGKTDSGILTVSKYQFADSTRYSLPVSFKWPVRTCNFKRCLMVNRIPVENTDKDLVLINLHLEAFDDGKGKEEQTKELLRLMNDEYRVGNYVIAGGDFNQTFSTVDKDAYPAVKGTWQPGAIDAKDFGENWSLRMDDRVPTARSLYKPFKKADRDDFPFYMLDGYIVSDNIKVDDIETIQFDFENTDHNPVLMEVTLK